MGCSGNHPPEAGAPRSSGPQRPAPGPAPAVDTAPEPLQEVVLITDPEALAVVAEAGGSFGAVIGGAAGANNEQLMKTRFGSVVSVLTGDLRAIARADRKAGVGVRGNIHRLFDARWLSGAHARFELIGIASRLDRMPFEAACGEARLIYRLAYTARMSGETVSSRLPMAIVVALAGDPRDPTAGCATAAARWRAPKQLAGMALGRWLTSTGPLAGLGPARVTRLEINLQSVRWPSSVRPDLGGHAEYLMRVFDARADGTRFDVGPLMNTPDVDRLRRDGRLRAELDAWIRANLETIDAGTAVLPDHLSATKITSVTPRGLARRANRPWRQLIDPRGANPTTDGLALENRRFVSTPEALVRRLDDMTCTGCHQGRTIAGFHLLGEDGADLAPGNALAVSRSPHLIDELNRRASLTAAIAAGSPADFARPFAERSVIAPGGYGDHCGLGDPGFAAWTCAAGLSCQRYDTPDDDAAVGVCLPPSPRVGDPCEVGALSPHRDPHRDRVAGARRTSCADNAGCNQNWVGFPGGMCTEGCSALSTDATCGVIAQLQPFNACLARKEPFPRCIANHVSPAGLRACDATRPCRDDYICARTPDGGGACTPPYFLFQLRVDGHP
ncbi:MAG TPA: hypothetical protein VML75_24270 [Kofleriaceae bacterium]|nr:hypothetical protein [Kofleriaceae bacterium]